MSADSKDDADLEAPKPANPPRGRIRENFLWNIRGEPGDREALRWVKGEVIVEVDGKGDVIVEVDVKGDVIVEVDVKGDIIVEVDGKGEVEVDIFKVKAIEGKQVLARSLLFGGKSVSSILYCIHCIRGGELIILAALLSYNSHNLYF